MISLDEQTSFVYEVHNYIKIFTHTCRIPELSSEPESGPYVNEKGELVLSKASPEDSGIYNCTAVDVAGSTAYQEFNIDVVAKGAHTRLCLSTVSLL